MTPRPGSRFTYGSTENVSSSRLLPQPRAPGAQPNGDNACIFSGSNVNAPDRKHQAGSWGWIRIAAVCAVALGVATIAVRSSLYKKIERTTALAEVDLNEGPATARAHAPAQDTIGRLKAENPSRLSFTALNFYHIRDGKPGQDYPWLKDIKFIEPYRETTLAVENPRLGYHYQWEMHGGGKGDEVHTSSNGTEAIVILTKLDKNLIILKEIDLQGTVVRRLDEPVMVKYVRREIRTLTDDEREELLDAVSAWVFKDLFGGRRWRELSSCLPDDYKSGPL